MKSNLKVVLLFFALVIAGAAIYSCKKSTVTPDPNLSIVVSRQIVVSAINPFTNDSIGQFTVAITTPNATINQTATGNTYVIKDPVAGNYSIVVSKTGYINVVAPVSLCFSALSAQVINAPYDENDLESPAV